MNFTTEIRRDLIRAVYEKRCCRLALLSGFLDTSGSWSIGSESARDGFSFTSESEQIADFLLGIVRGLFGVEMQVEHAVRDERHKRDKLTFGYYGERVGEFADEITDYSPANNLSDCCARAYLAGAFLGSGSCTLPREDKKTGYHLEVVFHCGFADLAAADFQTLLGRFHIPAGVVLRGEAYVVYLKSREAISDFLAVASAGAARARLEEVSRLRTENNYANRASNCLAGNADRAAIASVEQVVAFGKLKEKGILATLDAPLREAAEARLSHPERTLAELAEGLHITKSCLNHRLRKLMKLAGEHD